jgi:hypothetical protein
MIGRSHAARIAAMLAALAALSSCGGGGGGGGGPVTSPGPVPTTNPPLVALDATNAQSVAAGATLTGLGASSLSVQFQNALVTQRLLPRTHVLTRLVQQEIERLTHGLQSMPVAPLAAVVTATACTVSGSVAFDQQADSATETFSACSEVAGSSVSGTISIGSMNLSPGVSFSGSAGLNLTFSQTGFADVVITGSDVSVLETVNVSVNNVTLSGSQISVTTGSLVERLGNFTFMATIDASTETDRVTLNYSNSSIGGSIDVATVTPCVTNLTADFPNVGVLSLAGAGGSKIRVTINGDETFTTSTQVKIDLDANGDGTFETTLDKNWADLSV